jgi:hypothetical protein
MTELIEALARAIDEAGGQTVAITAVLNAILATIDTAGYQIVPKEPTEAMLRAADHRWSGHDTFLEHNAAVWEDMLAAAAKPLAAAPKPGGRR